MARWVPLGMLVALLLAAPAAAQQPQQELGEGATAAGAQIRDRGRVLGSIELTQVGERVEAVARFQRRPPGRKTSLCLTIAGDRRCVKRASKAGLELRLRDTAAFGASLRATARSADARASVEL